MTIRSSILHLTFAHPFNLAGYPEAFPAGSYDVLTEYELLYGLSFQAHRRVSTFLRVEARAGVTELLPTTENDLEAALARDTASQEISGPTTSISSKETK